MLVGLGRKFREHPVYLGDVDNGRLGNVVAVGHACTEMAVEMAAVHVSQRANVETYGEGAANREGAAKWFTGDARIDTITRGEDRSRVRVSAVRLTPTPAQPGTPTLSINPARDRRTGSRTVPRQQCRQIRPGEIIYTPRTGARTSSTTSTTTADPSSAQHARNERLDG
jgi:hypothetical protein